MPQTTLQKTVYWHRDMPPLDADIVGDHTIEADSSRVAGRLHNGAKLWGGSFDELMVNAEARLQQEIARLGGHFAHVYDESVTPKHDDSTGEGWLHGTFKYTLYRRPSETEGSSETEG